MQTVTDNQLQEMVNAIEDPATREHYSNIISGQITHELHCDSKLCGGRVIAHKYHDGQWVGDVQPKTVKKGNKDGTIFPTMSQLETHRVRFDGQTGFKCGCGNSSILAAAEEGVIGASPPSKNELRKIYGNLQDNPAKFAKSQDGSIEVDGFTIKPAKGQN